tara:strand:+ start:2270 stop:2548 length:279 start_codon:yes stop_codon:yes gene_type:complete
MHHIDQEIDRFQLSMMDLESMVDQNSYARLVDLFVQSLPLEELRTVLNLSSQIKAFVADIKGCFKEKRIQLQCFFKRKQRLRSIVNRYNINL